MARKGASRGAHPSSGRAQGAQILSSCSRRVLESGSAKRDLDGTRETPRWLFAKLNAGHLRSDFEIKRSERRSQRRDRCRPQAVPAGFRISIDSLRLARLTTFLFGNEFSAAPTC